MAAATRQRRPVIRGRGGRYAAEIQARNEQTDRHTNRCTSPWRKAPCGRGLTTMHVIRILLFQPFLLTGWRWVPSCTKIRNSFCFSWYEKVFNLMVYNEIHRFTWQRNVIVFRTLWLAEQFATTGICTWHCYGSRRLVTWASGSTFSEAAPGNQLSWSVTAVQPHSTKCRSASKVYTYVSVHSTGVLYYNGGG